MVKNKTKKEPNKFAEIEEVASKMLGHMKGLKNKYDKMDPVSKKKLFAGIAGVTGLLVGLGVAKKIYKNKKKA